MVIIIGSLVMREQTQKYLLNSQKNVSENIIKGIVEEQCLDDFLKSWKAKDVLKESAAQFQGLKLQSQVSFKLYLI